MEGPKRMREEASPELRRILRSSSIDEPPPGAMNKTLKRIGLAGVAGAAVTAVTGTAAAKTASPAVGAGVIGLLKWGAVGVVAGSLTLGTVKVVSTINTAREQPATSSSSALPSAPVKVQSRSAEAVMAGPSAAPSASAVPSATVRAAVMPSAVESAAPAPTSSGSSLTIEMQELEEVRSAIAQGRGREGLALLDAFAARHPRARLSEEASVLRIEALMASGASGQARSMAEEFLRTHPNSAFGDRVRSLHKTLTPALSPGEREGK